MAAEPKNSLDYLAAKTSQSISAVIGKPYGKREENKNIAANDVENLVTKALGILQSQGIYAMFLFLLSRSGDKTKAEEMGAEQRIACEVVAQLYTELKQEPIHDLFENVSIISWNEVNQKKEDILKSIAGILNHIDTVFLLRDLYEQTLIYARFGAKAASK